MAQLVLFDLDRFLGYDEAVYLSQVDPGSTAQPLAAHRARGTSWLVAPTVLAGLSLPATRLYLVCLSAALLFVAFAAWIPLVGSAAALGALLYGVSWPALLYATEVMPNHFAALMMVAALGLVGRAAARPAIVTALAAATWLAAAGFVRPTDALAVAAGAAAATLVVGPTRRRATLLGLIGAGAVAGWVPWIVEAVDRFGGPWQRLRKAAELHFELSYNLPRHLASTDGPLLGGDRGIPLGGLAWWVGLAVLVGLGLATAPRGERRAGLVTAVAASAAVTLPYFFLTRGEAQGVLAAVVAPRFLLPTYALLAPAAGSGLAAALFEPWAASGAPARTHRRLPRRALFILVAILAWAAWQISTARRIERREAAWRDSARAVAATVSRGAAGTPCLVVARMAWPQVEYASGCRGVRDRLVDPGLEQRLAELARPDETIFVLTQTQAERRDLPDGDGQRVRGRPAWRIHRVAP